MTYRTQDSIRFVAIGLVSIVAIALGAASISSVSGVGAAGSSFTLGPAGGDPGALNVTGPTTNGSFPISVGGPGIGIVANLSTCVQPLTAWYGGLVYFGAFGGVLYGVKRLYSLGASFLGMYALSPVAFTAYFLSTDCASAVGPSGPGGPLPPVVPGPDSPGIVPTQVSPLLVAGILGVALVGVAAVLYRASGDQSVAADPDEREAVVDQPDVADLADAAGRAADRLEDHNADVDNAVYRAWWEMTSLLRVPEPDTSTPGEFASAAIDLGMAESDVDRLTTLFEEVRYGQRDPESREERAVAVFRNIESAYAADDSAGRGSTGPDSDKPDPADGESGSEGSSDDGSTRDPSLD